MTTDPRLRQLGDQLEAAIARDVAATEPAVPLTRARRARRRRPTRRVAFALVAVLCLVPAGAFAATQLFSNEEVAASMPKGTLAFLDSKPTCTTVTADVEYHCTLAVAPTEFDDYTGTVEPTVDARDVVNGGCRSTNARGTDWNCYLGQRAVDEEIIGEEFLGEHSSGPGVG